jgi:hypothetical protein
MTGMLAWLAAIILIAAPPDAPRDHLGDVAVAVLDATGGDPLESAELVALGAREGHFDPWAVSRDYAGRAVGIWQVHETNFGWLHVDALDVVDPFTAAPIALRLVRESFRVCRARPLEERLVWYAVGGPACDAPEGIRDSRNRMGLALRLLRERPPPTVFLEVPETLRKVPD